MAERVLVQITSIRGRTNGGGEQPLQILGAGLRDRSTEVVVIRGGQRDFHFCAIIPQCEVHADR